MHNDFYGNKYAWFVGTVREVVDECYVRVRVFGIHPTMDTQRVSDSDLPLALVVYPVTGDQQGSGAPTHNLSIDSWVMGFFVDYPYCQQPVVTHAIQGDSISMSGYRQGGGEFVGQGEGSDEGPLPTDDGSSVNLTGNSNVERAYNYVREKLEAEGDSNAHLHASAWVGGLMVESGPSVSPTAVNPSSKAFGICQWLGSRKRQLFQKYGRTGRMDQQLDFMWWEMNHSESRSKQMLLASTNMADAVAAMSMFERAEDVREGRLNRGHSVYRKRYKFANQVYNTFSGRTTTPSTPPTTPSGPQ